MKYRNVCFQPDVADLYYKLRQKRLINVYNLVVIFRELNRYVMYSQTSDLYSPSPSVPDLASGILI